MSQYARNEGIMFSKRSSADMPEAFTPGQSFYRVHLRINTPTYCGMTGWKFETACEAWEADVREFIQSFGFEADKGGYMRIPGSPVYRLHLHPHDLSGELPMEMIERIHSELDGRQGTFAGHWTDIYERYEVVDESEIDKRFDYYRDDFKSTALEKLKTSRTTKYYSRFQWSALVSSLPGLRFGGEGSAYLEVVLHNMVLGLVSTGEVKMFTRDGYDYFRAANKSELRALRKQPRREAAEEGLQPALAF